MTSDHTSNELKEFDKRRGEFSAVSSPIEKANGIMKLNPLDLINDDIDDENWERISDCESNDEMKSSTVGKGQNLNDLNSKEKSGKQKRSKTFGNGGFSKGKENDTGDKFGGYEKREKYGKFENKSDRFDKYNSYENYDNYDTYDRHDNYSKYGKYDKYDKFNRFEKNDKYDNYNNYDNHYKERGYQKRDYNNNYKDKDYNDYNKFNSKEYNQETNKEYSKEHNKDYNKDYNKDFNRDYNKEFKKDYNKDYKDFNKEYSKDYKKNYNKDFDQDYRKDFNKDKDYNKDKDQKDFNRKDSFKEQGKDYNTSKTSFGGERKYSNKDSSYSNNQSFSSNNPTLVNKFDEKKDKKGIRNNYKKEESPKVETVDPKISHVNQVYNTNTNYTKKSDSPIKKSFEKGKSNYDSNSYFEDKSRDRKDYFKKDDKKKYNKDHKEYGGRDFNKKKETKPVDPLYDNLQKPVFINSKMMKEAEKLEEQPKTEVVENKIPSMSNMLNVPLNKIDEKINENKEKLILQQMSNVSINSTVIQRIEPEETTKINPINISSNLQSNQFNNQTQPQIHPQIQTQQNVMYSNYIRSPYMYPGYPNSLPNQGLPNFIMPFNMTMVPQANASDLPTTNSTPNLSQNNLYNNNQLTNYYGQSMQNLQNAPNMQYMFQNYYQNASVVPNENYQQEKHSEIDVKEFSDKLNLNAKIYIPKNKVNSLFKF
jgi:hypothetical protein